jgi:hypothetical protein
MNALYYPFHLCHERTLEQLLEKYHTIHFRDFMALQLTPMMGTTAFPDRMGDYYPQLLKAGRIAQRHNLSGPITADTALAVNRDLADAQWRNYFQESLVKDRRFQRGLFGAPKEGTTGPIGTPSKPEWLQFSDMEWATRSFDVGTVQALSRQRLRGEESAQFEYGWALIKTSASLIYTMHLCHQLKLLAATDSSAHYYLLARNCERDEVTLENICVKREGY